MSAVASLFGGPTHQREVKNDVVECVEALLQKAKAGELWGIAVAEVYWDNCGGTSIAGVSNYAQVGALEDLKLIALGVK